MAVQEQEDELPGAWTVLSCDGGEFSPAYSIDNMLIPDDSCVYSTAPGRSEDITVVLRHDGPGPFTLRAISCVAPAAGFTSPLGQALVFTSWDLPDPQQLPRRWSHVRTTEQFKLLTDLYHAQQLQAMQRYVAGLHARGSNSKASKRQHRRRVNHRPDHQITSDQGVRSLGRVSLLLAAATVGSGLTSSMDLDSSAAGTGALSLGEAASITIRAFAMCWGWQATWLVYAGRIPAPLPPPCLVVPTMSDFSDGHSSRMSEDPVTPSSTQNRLTVTPLLSLSRENSLPTSYAVDAAYPVASRPAADVAVQRVGLHRVASKPLDNPNSASAATTASPWQGDTLPEERHYANVMRSGANNHRSLIPQPTSCQVPLHAVGGADMEVSGQQGVLAAEGDFVISSRGAAEALAQQRPDVSMQLQSWHLVQPASQQLPQQPLQPPSQGLLQQGSQQHQQQQQAPNSQVQQQQQQGPASSAEAGRMVINFQPRCLPALPPHQSARSAASHNKHNLHSSSSSRACGDLGLPPSPPCPAAFIDLKDRPCCTVPVEPPLSGRYVLVKLLRSKFTYADNLDVSYLGLHTHCGPHAFGSVAFT